MSVCGGWAAPRRLPGGQKGSAALSCPLPPRPHAGVQVLLSDQGHNERLSHQRAGREGQSTPPANTAFQEVSSVQEEHVRRGGSNKPS